MRKQETLKGYYCYYDAPPIDFTNVFHSSPPFLPPLPPKWNGTTTFMFESERDFGTDYGIWDGD